MADEGLHEIHLKSKQLVALFMTAAVLLVVTFLCGVLVGRGVRARKEPTLAAAAAGQPVAAPEDPTAAAPLQPVVKTAPQPAATPPTTPPPQTEEDINYFSRLQGQTPPAESVKPAAGAARAATPSKPLEAPSHPAAVAAPVVTTPAPRAAAQAAPATAAKARPTEVAASADPAGPGYVVKIVAYRDKAQSSALAARLSGKGYPAYVVTVSGKGAPLYSVRVGKFKTRDDAEAARKRLEKEEQFKPLITR